MYMYKFMHPSNTGIVPENVLYWTPDQSSLPSFWLQKGGSVNNTFNSYTYDTAWFKLDS